VAFELEDLQQAGPYWNSYNDVYSSSTFIGYSNPNSYSPGCSWGDTTTNAYTVLYWVQ
jgi:hypothetical protein